MSLQVYWMYEGFTGSWRVLLTSTEVSAVSRPRKLMGTFPQKVNISAGIRPICCRQYFHNFKVKSATFPPTTP